MLVSSYLDTVPACSFLVGHISMLKWDISIFFKFVKVADVFVNEIKWDDLVNPSRLRRN